MQHFHNGLRQSVLLGHLVQQFSVLQINLTLTFTVKPIKICQEL